MQDQIISNNQDKYMRPRRIILVRHGESVGNVDRNVYESVPDYKLVLSSLGRQQAVEAGKKLKEMIKEESSFFYISPHWRTRETFKYISESFESATIRTREEPRIREQEWGHLRNLEEFKKIDKERAEFGRFYFRMPNGESPADVYDRVSDFFGTLHRDFDKQAFPENCIIITHGMTIRLFLMRWFHWTVEEFEEIKNPDNCAVIIMEKQENGRYKLVTELEKKELL